VQARAALVRLTNARLRAEAEAGALARRLAAARSMPRPRLETGAAVPAASSSCRRSPR